MSKARRELATVVEYHDLLMAFRARAHELQISRLSIDALGDLADGHASKILGLSKTRRMGLSALGPMLRALALKIVIVDDPEQRERNAERLERRRENCVRHASPQPSDSSAVA